MLVGRQAEVDELSDLLRGDRPVVVLGESGIGKTALLRECLAATTRRALFGGALASLSWMEYVPLARALGVRRLTGDPPAVAQKLRAKLGDDGTLALDDLHWADPGTLQVVELLADVVPMVAAVRSGAEGSDTLVERLERLGFLVFRLAPLAPEDAADLVRSLRADASDIAVSRLVRRCGGVPLLLTRLAGPKGEASESLRISLSSRLQRVSDEAADLFGLLAVIGRPVSLSLVDAPHVDELVGATLAVRRDDEVEVAHAVLADLAGARLSDDERRALHRRAAQLATDSGERARHLEASGDLDEARALALRAAAEAEERPAEASAHLAVAARCSVGQQADELRLRAANALLVALRHEDANRILDEVQATDAPTRAEVAILRSRAAWYLGDDDGFREALDVALRESQAGTPDLQARALVERSRRSIFLDSDLEPGGVAQSHEALDVARAAGIPTARAEMLAGIAHYMADELDWRQHLESAFELARSEGDLDTELSTANNLITTHESAGDPAVGRALAAAMIERAEAVGMIGWQLQFRAMLLNLDLHAADYLGAVSQAVELLDEPLDARARAQIESSLAICLVDLGRTEIARQRVDELEGGPRRDLVGLDTIRWLQSEVELHGGRPASARDKAREAIELGMTDPLASIVERWALFELGEDLGELPEPHAMPMFRAVQPESLGLSALARGDATTALPHFDKAAALYRPYHRRGEFRSMWGAAESARRAGDTGAAERRFIDLETELSARQMLPMLARVHKSMRAMGLRRSATRSRRTANELTGRQLEVMQLVVGGCTNAEIGRRLGISRSTVTELVGNAMHSMGATSRGQAAALLSS